VSDSLHDSQSNGVNPTRPSPRVRARSSGAHRRERLACALLALACLIGAGPSRAADEGPSQMQSLDEQVQEIKSDVLRIAADLDQLEEKLLYPSDTEVSIFVSLADGEEARLDSVHIDIDGEPVAQHVYSFKELEALRKGGVQRIYTGNLPTGTHRVDVTVAGKLGGDRDFGGSESFTIEKALGPELVGIELASSASGGARIRIEDE